MGWTLGKLGDRRLDPFRCLVVGAAIGVMVPSMAIGQVRGKLPDRGVYQPPRIGTVQAESIDAVDQPASSAGVNDGSQPAAAANTTLIAELVDDPLRSNAASTPNSGSTPITGSQGLESSQASSGKKLRPLIEVVLEDPGTLLGREIEADARSLATTEMPSQVERLPEPRLRQVAHEEVMLVPPTPPADFEAEPNRRPIGKLAAFPHNEIATPISHHDATCDGCAHCDGYACDSIGCGVFGCDSFCDTLGCDSMGGCAQPWYHRWTNASIRFDRDRWFGGLEYLMMWRRGDRLPALVTTGTAATPNPDTAGELGQAGTLVLVGQDRIMERLSSGARLTIGTWLDDRECLSLVGRGWYGGKKNYDYDQNQTSILARPFLNVSDDQTPAQDTLLIAFPTRATGAVHVDAQSEAFGADISLRQFLYSDLGVTFDFMYGYQFMRVNESLGISSTSTSLDEDFAPVGAVLSVSDYFGVSNEFHGGQVGLATNYRERCWSFNCLAKIGFGSLRREATRSGRSVTTLDDQTAVDNVGLLVRSTNSGTVTDHTFGWVPELDLSLGWQRFAGWDLTFGYHIIGLTDALQPSGAIDPNLAVNLSEPPLGQQRPTDSLRYRTYYLQGIHFGLQHVY